MPAKPKRRITKTTSIIVTVTNGVPSQPSVQISKTQRVVFVNTDNTEYLFELWNQDNDDHIVVCPVLAANARARARSSCGLWCGMRFGCARIDWLSVRFAALNASTYWLR